MEYVGKLVKSFTYADTSSFTIGALPPNCVITDIRIVVRTAFNAGSNDYLDIGTTSSAAAIVDNADLATKGVVAATLATTVNDALSTSNSVTIKGIYVPSGSAPTAGAGDIVISFVQR